MVSHGARRAASHSRSVRMPEKPFNLRFWFAVTGLVTVLLIAMGMAGLLSDFIARSLLQREAEVSQEFLESVVAVDGETLFADDLSGPVASTPALRDFARHVTSLPGAVRVNIYAKTRRILWSTDKTIVGTVPTDADELDKALGGVQVTKFGEPEEELSASEAAMPGADHLIETYIPIRAEAGLGPIVGVVEFYKLPFTLESTIDTARNTVWVGTAIGALLLFAALYGIVLRADRIIRSQQNRLTEARTLVAVGQMAAAVAHSLRNPMFGIRSTAELWRHEAADATFADDIISEVDRMDGHVRDLLAYARSETCLLAPVDPNPLVSSTLAKHAGAIRRAGITVTTRDQRSDGRAVLADARLLEHALASVVSNAVEAMERGGALDLLIAPGAGANRVRIAVSDTGPGIPEALRQKVSESYFTTKEKGLGLGLVIARGIVDRLGGSLDFRASGERGTTVTIELDGA